MPSTPSPDARSISRCSRSVVASASSRARWVGLWSRRKRDGQRAQAAVRHLVAHQPAGEGDGVDAHRVEAGVAGALERVAQERHVEADVVADEDRAAQELEQRRQHGLDARRRRDERVGEAGQHRDLRGDGAARVDERLERAEELAAADLDRADLGDHVVDAVAAGRLEVEHAERDVGERRPEVVEAALDGPVGRRAAPPTPRPARSPDCRRHPGMTARTTVRVKHPFVDQVFVGDRLTTWGPGRPVTLVDDGHGRDRLAGAPLAAPGRSSSPSPSPPRARRSSRRSRTRPPSSRSCASRASRAPRSASCGGRSRPTPTSAAASRPARLPELVDPIGIEWLRRTRGGRTASPRWWPSAEDGASQADEQAALRRAEKRREAAEHVAARTRVELAALQARIDELHRRAGGGPLGRPGHPGRRRRAAGRGGRRQARRAPRQRPRRGGARPARRRRGGPRRGPPPRRGRGDPARRPARRPRRAGRRRGLRRPGHRAARPGPLGPRPGRPAGEPDRGRHDRSRRPVAARRRRSRLAAGHRAPAAGPRGARARRRLQRRQAGLAGRRARPPAEAVPRPRRRRRPPVRHRHHGRVRRRRRRSVRMQPSAGWPASSTRGPGVIADDVIRAEVAATSVRASGSWSSRTTRRSGATSPPPVPTGSPATPCSRCATAAGGRRP